MAYFLVFDAATGKLVTHDDSGRASIPGGMVVVIPNDDPRLPNLLAGGVVTATPGQLARFTVEAPPVKEDAEGLRLNAGSIFSGTSDARRARMVDVIEKYPPLGTALNLLRGELSLDVKAFIAEISGRVRSRIGTADEVMTRAEYSALKTLATSKGLGALIP